MDGVIKESIKAKIKEIATEFNLTTIIVTHDPEEALTLSDRVLIINDGKIIRRAAIDNNVAVFTCLDTVKVLLDVLEEITMGISVIDKE